MKVVLISVFMFAVTICGAQQFEEAKLKVEDFKDIKIKTGVDLTLQYQALNHSYKRNVEDEKLIPLGFGFNLPTANLNLSGIIAPGIRVNLTTYLSSRHHQEAWVKDGYILMDAMKFFNSSTIDDLMKDFRIKIGMMEINYGDAHFRRSDNGNSINNIFVGNYIMDAFTTSIGMELYYQKNNLLAMVGFSNGALKPELVGIAGGEYVPYNTAEELAYFFKIGYDKQIDDDFRIRATASAYISPEHHKGSLYSAERAGSRYYFVMNEETENMRDATDASQKASSGRWGPGSTSENNAYMFNFFTKYKRFEFFGTYEMTSGKTSADTDFDLSQVGVEGIYRLGSKEQLYLGARYNIVHNDAKDASDAMSRLQLCGGYNLTKNLVAKVEYVLQEYDNVPAKGDGQFDGYMFEFAVSF
jgi:hypothetical protein